MTAGDQDLLVPRHAAGAPGSFALPISIADAQGRTAVDDHPVRDHRARGERRDQPGLRRRRQQRRRLSQRLHRAAQPRGGRRQRRRVVGAVHVRRRDLVGRHAADRHDSGRGVLPGAGSSGSRRHDFPADARRGRDAGDERHVRQGGAGRGLDPALPAPARVRVRWTSSATAATTCFEGTGSAPTLSDTTAAIRRTAASPTPTTTRLTSSPARLSRRARSGVNPDRRWSAASPGSRRQPAARVRLTVTVTPGAFPPSPVTGVLGRLSLRVGGGVQAFVDDGTHGDVTAGDGVYSLQVVGLGHARLPDADRHDQRRPRPHRLDNDPPRRREATERRRSRRFRAAARPRRSSASSSRPPGIVTALRSSGFYIQTPDGADDGNPATSEGLFVFMSGGGRAAGGRRCRPRHRRGVGVRAGAARAAADRAGRRPGLRRHRDWPAAAIAGAAPARRHIAVGRRRTARTLRGHARHGGPDASSARPTARCSRPRRARDLERAVLRGDRRRPAPGPRARPRSAAAVPPALPCCVPRFDGNPERLRVDSAGQTGSAHPRRRRRAAADRRGRRAGLRLRQLQPPARSRRRDGRRASAGDAGAGAERRASSPSRQPTSNGSSTIRTIPITTTRC